MRTSYSALETYKLCPQKYKFQEIDRIPSKKAKAAQFGTLIHGALRYMFSPGPLFPTLDEVLNYFHQHWPADEIIDVTPEEKSLYLAEGERILKNFYSKNAPWNFSVVDLEARFEVVLEDPTTHEAHVLVGRIDRIDKTNDGYEVIDYKTSRTMPSQDAVDRDLQMSVYSLGLQKRWPHVEPEAITLSLYFVKHNEKLSTKRTRAATIETTHDILSTLGQIQKNLSGGERFEPTPGPHCSFCPFKPLCPAWRHLYKKPESATPDAEEINKLLDEYLGIVKTQHEGNKRLAGLKAKLVAYMDAEGFERLFGETGTISRTKQQRFRYDFEKVRAILEPLGKWEKILDADEKKLKLVLSSLPPEVQSAIEATKILTSEFSVLSVSTKRIAPPIDEHH